MRVLMYLGAAILVVVVGACIGARPVIDTGPKPSSVDGTIAGTVRTASAGTPLVGRRVTATEVASGTKHEMSTSNTGGFSFKLPPGTYRLSVELRAGEVVSKDPGQTDVNASDLDAGRDFEISVAAR